ncbi:zinc finger protein Rlf [Alosa pseudoharengus]|uniref:zinc finger protein Rlf n=1 Tax=Alosa pseudoharengus TaxID=34774 RepID=UPI003F898478
MADGAVEAEPDWADQLLHTVEDSFLVMDSLQATLQRLEFDLRQKDISENSSTEYCNNFCQVLMHYAGSRNSVEHGLPLLEVYCLSINCFAAARPHLTSESDSVALVLKRLALSCFELLLSVPVSDVPYNTWMQFHHSVQVAHDSLLQYGSTDLQALLQITQAGGPWNLPILIDLLTGQPTDPEELCAFIALEGDGFMEMRIKHLEKLGELDKAMILMKACANCILLPNYTGFRQTFVSQLCKMLPNDEAVLEISRLDGKDVLDIICNMETEGDENSAHILCTTYLTWQLQEESLYCSWELTLLWSKLQRRTDPSLESFLERSLQFGAIAKTAYHLLFLIQVVQTEALQLGLRVSVELCVKALQLPSQEDNDTRTAVCKTVACLLSEDLEVLRACQLTEFLLKPSHDSFTTLEELYQQPDQKYDEENGIIPNSLRCELLLALKAIWPFDPEFWDWKTLKHHCNRLLGLQPEKEEEEETTQEVDPLLAAKDFKEKEEERDQGDKSEIEKLKKKRETVKNCESRISSTGHEDDDQNEDDLKSKEGLRSPSKKIVMSERSLRWQKYKFCCLICKKEVIEARFLHHSKKHEENGVFTCPVCLQKFQGKQEFSPHISTHSQMPARGRNPQKKKKVKKKVDLEKEMDEDEVDDLEPGEIALDPSIRMYYESTHDPDVLDHILEQAAAVPRKQADQDYITFDYISTHFAFQDREVYTCPATNCSKNFKLVKYLSMHLKDHKDGDRDPNIKHYLEMKDKREKCSFCRKHFMTAYHHRKHRRVHFGDQPYMCIVTGCGARFNAINKLVEHKHSHAVRLGYQCELKGCSISFSDLGQLYHHEAQHFRNAAYHCTSPGCKKFFYSRKEFLKHLVTHGITFTEDDFEAQRERQRKLVDATLEEETTPKMPCNSNAAEVINALQKDTTTTTTTTTACSSSPCQNVDCKDFKGSLTNVAVCFDGEKFTCGFEKCRKTFSKTKDIQRHLKCAHPEQVKIEKKGCKKVNKDKGLKTDIKTDTGGQDVKLSVSPLPSHETGIPSTEMHTDPITTSSTNSAPKDSLTDILLSLSKLSLHCPFSRKGLCDPVHPESDTLVTPSSSPPANSSSKLTSEKSESKPGPPVETKKQQLKNKSNDGIPAETQPETCKMSSFLIQPTTKPYTCDIKGCSYQSVTSQALKRHYQTKHNISDEEVKGLEKFKAEFKFKPFKCHLCPKGYREKKELRSHYMQMHNISEAVVDQMSCSVKKRDESKVQDSPKSKVSLKLNSKKDSVEEDKPTDVPVWRSRSQRRKGLALTKLERENDQAPEQKSRKCKDLPALQHNHCEDGVTKEGRGSRRLVAKNNLCYILTNYHKPFHCVHKDCNSAFTNQTGLVRHLQIVHHYKRSQLSLEGEQNVNQNACVKKEPAGPNLFFCKYNGCGKHFHHAASLYRHNRRVHRKVPSRVLHTSRPLSTLQRREPVSEEPIPRFKCTYANCNASYHLNSSLLRHTNNEHCDQNSLSQTAQKSPTPLVRCNFEGCTRVFSQNSNYRRHVFYRHYEYYESVVVQNANKKDKPASGCQKKLITHSPKLPLRHSLRFCPKPQEVIQSEESTEESVEESINENVKKEKSPTQSSPSRRPLVFRSHEEALQMCQDRCLPVAFPCMVQDCNTVVTLLGSMRRHYKRVHKMSDFRINLKKDKLVLNSEQLEEIIQKKSALVCPDIVRSPSGVLKMEYQAEPDNPGGPPLPMSLHSIKTAQMEERDIVVLSEKPPSDSSILDADNLLYGETPGHTEALPEVQSSHSQEISQPQSPNPPPVQATLVDLSPPPSLRISVDEGFDSSGNDSSKSTRFPATPAPSVTVPITPPRQPLKRKNEVTESPQPLSPSLNSKDFSTLSPAPNTFDLATYKPMGFESSFLKFIQESREKEDIEPVMPEPFKRRECCRRNYSVKENSQMGFRITRSRLGRASPLKPLLSASEFHSVENLHYILDRALTGCGDDQAIKQLQYLRPVVVLERSKLS